MYSSNKDFLTIFHLIRNINNDNNFQMLHHLIISIQFDVRRRFRMRIFQWNRENEMCERKELSFLETYIFILISKFTKWNRRKIDYEMHFFFRVSTNEIEFCMWSEYPAFEWSISGISSATHKKFILHAVSFKTFCISLFKIVWYHNKNTFSMCDWLHSFLLLVLVVRVIFCVVG